MITKVCSKCNVEKGISLFSKHSGCKGGYHTICKECMSKNSSRHYNSNIELSRIKATEKRKDNLQFFRERDRLTYIKRKDKKSIYDSEYRLNNKSKRQYWNSKRRAAILSRTPKWLSPSEWSKIKSIYDLSERLTKCIGVQYHVDHIIPLQGELVSGLHVSSNLQVIPAKSNISKGNKWQIY